MTFDTPFAAAAERNAWPIFGVLSRELPEQGSVLEIGTGTAQQAVVFASELPGIHWQPSDVAANLDGISARLQAEQRPNIADPVELDVLRAPQQIGQFDHAYSSNTAHIMSEEGVEAMFQLLGRALKCGGLFCLYGPFRVGGQFTTDSNARFDAMLRGQDASMGLRDLETLDKLAMAAGMRRLRLYALPSNNLLVIWRMEKG
ncbi:MAG: DUF938 domain-containing protein [Woeseiaceae bacterium]